MDARSFLSIAPDSDFSIDNLPYGIFSTLDNPVPRVGIAIGDCLLDLQTLSCFGGPELGQNCNSHVFQKDSLNDFIRLGHKAWREARLILQRILSKDDGYLRDNTPLQKRALVPQIDVQMYMPVKTGNFTDFSSSKKHAENDQIMFTDKNHRILPNWNYIPVAYHSRASSIVVSGHDIVRPFGQYIPAGNGTDPCFQPTQKLDFEMEIGAIIGEGNPLGQPIKVGDADEHVFGFVLLNDWSARDIQGWEWMPLGPFLCKNFATSISPWIVTADALKPFLCPSVYQQDPAPLPYLQTLSLNTYDINLTASLRPFSSDTESQLCRSNYKFMYWTLAQQIAHHTSNGCNLLPGDLIGSGTVSGPTPDMAGSLSELSERGTKPVAIGGGERRSFLEDGDEVIIRGRCQNDQIRLGFGSCRGTIRAAFRAE